MRITANTSWIVRIRSFLAFAALSWLMAACGTNGESVEQIPADELVHLDGLNASSQIEPADDISLIPTPRPRMLWVGELVLAAPFDAVPAIFASEDLFLDSDDGDLEWEDDEPVVGLEIFGDARAYPVSLLSLHEIVNDVVGGEPVAITWCPLCYSSLVFDRVVDQTLTFGVSGYLYYNNLVMYDHQTNTLWSQMLAQGMRGALRGRRLELLPSELTTWGAWKERHPDTRVLSAKQLGRQAEDVIDPYGGYYTSGYAGVTGWKNPDVRLKAKDLVAGVVLGREVRAYPVATIRETRMIQDELGTTPLLLVYDERLGTVLVYRRDVGDRTLVFDTGSAGVTIRDLETGTAWDLRTGEGLEGPLAGSRLARISAPLVFWFAWSDIHPGTEIFQERAPTD
ncbi:MAG: DUF3179 domain-containing protein [Anaerolineales bacterium]|nr:DUF3179 domain-containing protein [Anaerolineales bacterium]